MHSATLIVESYLSGCRVDTFLAKHFRSYTPWRMHRMVRAGQVTVQGTVAQPDRRVFTDEAVTVRLLEPPDNLMPAEEITFGVVFEDQWLLIVNKPAGLIRTRPFPVNRNRVLSTGSIAIRVVASPWRKTTCRTGCFRCSFNASEFPNRISHSWTAS